MTHTTLVAAASRQRWSSGMLRLLLVLRLLWNASFTVMLVKAGPQSFSALLEAFSRFAFVDGLLALLVAGGYLTIAPGRMLWISPTVDAGTRGVLVGLLFVGPGISGFPLTALLYVGLIATFACFDGVLDIIEGFALRHEFGRRGGTISLILSGSILALLGATLFVTSPTTREVGFVLALLSATHALSFVPAVIHVGQLRRALLRPSGSQQADAR